MACLSQYLSTGYNLMLKKVLNIARCPICTNEDESILHALWECLRATDVWGNANSPLRKLPSHFTDIWKLWTKMGVTLLGQLCTIFSIVGIQSSLIKFSRTSPKSYRNRFTIWRHFEKLRALFVASLGDRHHPLFYPCHNGNELYFLC